MKVASRCKYTIIGMFSNPMPKMETIRKQFVLQTVLRGSVRLTHFNAIHLYIDLDDEYDHSTIWSEGRMYIEGQMIRLLLWRPTFKPDVETPLVPIWVVLSKLPWQCYCMEILAPLVSPIGKALFFDLAT